jgi:hypothetical protein
MFESAWKGVCESFVVNNAERIDTSYETILVIKKSQEFEREIGVCAAQLLLDPNPGRSVDRAELRALVNYAVRVIRIATGPPDGLFFPSPLPARSLRNINPQRRERCTPIV